MKREQAELRQQFLRRFEKIYVINLPHRTDRKRQIEKQLGCIGLSFSDSEVVLFEASRPESKGKWPSIGARGCFSSHLNVLKHAATHNCETILILEDDADWSVSFLANTKDVLKQVENLQWDFLHGGIEPGPEPPCFHSLSSEQKAPLTHFIALKRNAVPRIASYLETMAERESGDPHGGPMHVDGAYSWFRKDNPDISAHIAEPAIAQQRPSRTDIHDLAWSDKVPVLSSVKNSLRSIMHTLRKKFSTKR